jgi:hypothetical protein
MAAAATARRAAAPARAPSRKAPARKKPVKVQLAPAPARKTAPGRGATPARRAPARRPGGQLIPIAVGAATAARNLPDSSLVVRMTRGRAWIAVLGLLLVGIVAVNVITLSLSAAAGHIDQNITALEQENSLLSSRVAERSGSARVRYEAAALGLAPAVTDQITGVTAGSHDVAIAAQRLAAAGTGY